MRIQFDRHRMPRGTSLFLLTLEDRSTDRIVSSFLSVFLFLLLLLFQLSARQEIRNGAFRAGGKTGFRERASPPRAVIRTELKLHTN